MNTINSNNCEAWMLDYFEGSLTSRQSKVLLQFLEVHPDWQKVFDEYAGHEEPAVLSALPFAGEKTFLNSVKKIDRDEDLIALTEGMLSNADSSRLMKQISMDEVLAADFSIYQKIKLKPDSEIQFAEKNKLKKKAAVIPLFLRYSAVAAMLCGALFAAWLFNNTATVEQNVSTENTTGKSANELNNDQLSDKTVLQRNDTDEQSDNMADPSSQSETPQPANRQTIESIKSGTKNLTNSGLPVNQKQPDVNAESRSEVALAAMEPKPIAKTLFEQSVGHTLPNNSNDVPPSASIAEWDDAEQSNGIAGLINKIGKNLLGRVQDVTDEQIVIEQQKEPEEEVYTSTFKLGSFEVYRSRTKK